MKKEQNIQFGQIKVSGHEDYFVTKRFSKAPPLRIQAIKFLTNLDQKPSNQCSQECQESQYPFNETFQAFQNERNSLGSLIGKTSNNSKQITQKQTHHTNFALNRDKSVHNLKQLTEKTASLQALLTKTDLNFNTDRNFQFKPQKWVEKPQITSQIIRPKSPKAYIPQNTLQTKIMTTMGPGFYDIDYKQLQKHSRSYQFSKKIEFKDQYKTQRSLAQLNYANLKQKN